MSKIVGTNHLAHMPKEERVKEMRLITRRVYGTEEGALVLTALLHALYFTREATTPQEVALKNFATFYLEDALGISLGHSATVALLNKEVPK